MQKGNIQDTRPGIERACDGNGGALVSLLKTWDEGREHNPGFASFMVMVWLYDLGGGFWCNADLYEEISFLSELAFIRQAMCVGVAA